MSSAASTTNPSDLRVFQLVRHIPQRSSTYYFRSRLFKSEQAAVMKMEEQ